MSETAPLTVASDVLTWLAENGSRKIAEGNARFALPVDVDGVSVPAMRAQTRTIGTDHDLARDLWHIGGYERRMMAILLADPKRMDRMEADAWTSEFDNWALCDTACFHLYRRTAFRWEVVRPWAGEDAEFVRRAAFAMLWALAVHDKTAPDERFTEHFDLFRQHSSDARNYISKAIDMALRAIGKRNLALNEVGCLIAVELKSSDNRTASSIGRHVLSELRSEKVRSKLGRP